MNDIKTPEYHSVLVPVDFSETSENALNYAVEMAKLFNNKIVLLNVISGSFLTSIFAGESQKALLMEGINKKMEEYKQLVLDIWKDAVVETKVLEGKPHRVINDLAKEMDCDTIVMGTNGANKVEMFAGSTTLRVIGSSEVPVIVVKERREHPKFENIVLPIDLTKTSRQKIDWAVKFAKQYNSTVHILMEIEKDELLKKKVTANLKVAEAIFAENGVAYKSHLLDDREYPDHLGKDTIQFAEKNNADLIMIMTKAENAKISEFFVGSYAQQVIKSAQSTPVMCISPKQTGSFATSGTGFYG